LASWPLAQTSCSASSSARLALQAPARPAGARGLYHDPARHGSKKTMETLQKALEFALDPANDFLGVLATHLKLSGLALFLAVLVGVPLGIWISRYGAFARPVINVVGIVRVIPSIAVLFVLLLISPEIGFRPSVIALTLLAIPPLLINTDAGMRGVDPATIEAGRGLGMSDWQLLRKVQLPLALPVILAGLRIATVEVIASATLASLIGGGGLGDFIYAGLSLLSTERLLVGAVPAALLALGAEFGLGYLERAVAARERVRPGVGGQGSGVGGVSQEGLYDARP
jgi:osmoprotectant transport system permease protein